MKIRQHEGSQERRILTHMIVDKTSLAAVTAKWEKPGLFSSRWGNIIGTWCVEHFKRYRKPPGKDIEGLFDSWSTEKRVDKETVDLVGKFLSSLSGEYQRLKKEVSPQFVIDMAALYFSRVRLQRMSEEIQAAIEEGDIEKAEQIRQKCHRVEMGAGAWVDVFGDTAALTSVYEEPKEPLVTYPDALGTFFGDSLHRDNFIAFMGPDKTGKTFWLIDLAWRAVLQHRKVAFFELGDMSQNQIMRRFIARATRIPYKGKPYKFPKFLEPGDPPTVDLEDIDVKHPPSYDQAKKAFDKKKAKFPGAFRLSCHSNGTLTVGKMESILEEWERESGWVPDVICADYADLFSPPPGYSESRDQINHNWKAMRGLSQSIHCLFATATQSDANAYKTDLIGRTNFSDDKRKLAHVTDMIGLNQTKPEKEQQLMRVNHIVLREDEFSADRCVYVATCMALAMPAVLSVF